MLSFIGCLFRILLILPSLVRRNSEDRRFALVSGVPEALGHIATLWQQTFYLSPAQSLRRLTIGATSSFMIFRIITPITFRNRDWFLVPIIYSFAMIDLTFSSFMSGKLMIYLKASAELITHILLTLFSYTIPLTTKLYSLPFTSMNYLLEKRHWPSAMPYLL